MNFLEKDLEDILEHTNQFDIRSRGLECFEYDTYFRQKQLGSGNRPDFITLKILRYPRADPRGNFRCIRITVYELKRTIVDLSAYYQCSRYISVIHAVINRIRTLNQLKRTSFQVAGVLIGRSLELKDQTIKMLASGLLPIEYYQYSYAAGGLVFKRLDSFGLADHELDQVSKMAASEVSSMLDVNRYLNAVNSGYTQAPKILSSDKYPF